MQNSMLGMMTDTAMWHFWSMLADCSTSTKVNFFKILDMDLLLRPSKSLMEAPVMAFSSSEK